MLGKALSRGERWGETLLPVSCRLHAESRGPMGCAEIRLLSASVAEPGGCSAGPVGALERGMEPAGSSALQLPQAGGTGLFLERQQALGWWC